MRYLLLALMLMVCSLSYAQRGILKGRIADAISNESIPLATVALQGTGKGTKTDTIGNFEIRNLPAGLYNIEVSYLGYQRKVIYEIAVDNSKPTYLEILLEKKPQQVQEVKIKGRKDRTEESPLSLRSIGVNEIQRNPGGNRDISKVIQSLPGAGSSVGFRNDIIIRGGGPSENRFYLDGMEIPNLNHFATQGANGGPVGILNVDFLQDVGYYSGSFPANRGNTLSSVFDFKLKDPRRDGWHAAFTVGSSDIGLRTEGPINDKSGLMVSVRRSYLQFLFAALKLPFLPTYNDAQVKYKIRLDDKNELSYLFVGAYDVAVLNTDNDETDQQKFLLGVLPEQRQWSYTNGLVYKHYRKNSYQTIVLSRNMFDNYAYKHPDNNKSLPPRFEYRSQEIENKLRIENTLRANSWKINYGTGLEYVRYNNQTRNEIALPGGLLDTVNFKSALDFIRYGLFAQISRTVFQENLTLSAGIRMDGASYSQEMANPLEQFSPRISASYRLNDRINLNMNTGIYYQLPAYTILGFRDMNGSLVNRSNGIENIRSKHAVAGIEYNTQVNARFTVEAFYKHYNQYPQAVNTGLSFANTGGDFGVVGNESFRSVSTGRAYGLELFAQQKLFKGYYALAAITLFRSEFSNANRSQLTPSNWDQRFIINLTAGKKFKRNWELGAKFRFTGGRPITPYDTLSSSIQQVWDVAGQGQFDFNRINQSRLPINHQLDWRLDKKWFFKRWNLNLFIDIQNTYAFQAREQDILTVQRGPDGQPLPDPNASNPARYQLQFLSNTNGTVLPTLGIIIEY